MIFMLICYQIVDIFNFWQFWGAAEELEHHNVQNHLAFYKTQAQEFTCYQLVAILFSVVEFAFFRNPSY